jgi:hypothetical protein
VFANPGRPPDVLSSADVLRFLRLITSPASRREERVPLSAVATLADLSGLGQPSERADVRAAGSDRAGP